EAPAQLVGARRTIRPDAQGAAFDIAVDQVPRLVLARRFPHLKADQHGDDESGPEHDADGRLRLQRQTCVKAAQPEDGETRRPESGGTDGANEGWPEQASSRGADPGVELFSQAKSVSHARSNPGPAPG